MSHVIEGLFFIISGEGSQVVSGFFRINTFPVYSNLGQSESVIISGSPVVLSAYWSDSTLLDYAWLATNETGAWENKAGIYGSPIAINEFSGWSNFTWSSPTFYGTLYWRIYANNTLGNTNSSEVMSFQVLPGTLNLPGNEVQGGGGIPSPSRNFTMDKEFLKTSVKQGETILEYLRINNTGNAVLDFNITVQRLEKNVMLSEESFLLNPGESRTVSVAFTAKDDMNPDIYSGRLIVSAGDITKSIMLIMEVKSRKSLFDLYVSLPETPFEVLRGEEVSADIFMYNFGEIKPIDVALFYSLRDFSGKEILFSHETVTVDEQKLVKKNIRIPKDLEYGFYLFYARIEYSNQTATSSGLIKLVEGKPEVQKETEYNISYMAIMLFSIAIITFILLFTFWKIHRRIPSVLIGKKRHINEEKISAPGLKKIKEEIEDLEFMAKAGKKKEEENPKI
jgi:hypothetical protein